MASEMWGIILNLVMTGLELVGYLFYSEEINTSHQNRNNKFVDCSQ